MKSLTLCLLLLLSLSFAGGCTPPREPINDAANSSEPLLGGDRDEHGCIPSAGYQWCEVKQKCLRVWEEPCETGSGSAMDTSGWSVYDNQTLGITLNFPPSWEGFVDTYTDYPRFSHVAFSFRDGHRPFELFKIMKFSEEQWESDGKNYPFTVLKTSGGDTFACDGCCTPGGDTTGGGQFDDFQQERCAEVPQILRTFNVTP